MYATLPTTKPIRSADPTFEPITLAEAARQVGLAEGISYHNETLASLIKTAREQVEHDTGLVCATGTFTWTFTDWPCETWFEIPSVRPVTSITSIVYTAADGTSTTWSSANYVAPTQHEVTPTVKLAYLQSWPTLRGDINGVTVTMVAGYATQAAVPMRVKQACLYLVNHWFVNRDTVSTGTISPEISLTYDALISGLMRSTYP